MRDLRAISTLDSSPTWRIPGVRQPARFFNIGVACSILSRKAQASFAWFRDSNAQIFFGPAVSNKILGIGVHLK